MAPNIVLPDPPLPNIDRQTYRLPNNQYVNEHCGKTGIVLHHTISSNVQSVYNWWLEKGQTKVIRVGTAYVVHSDGTIYEFFPDTMWAWHLGKGCGTANEMRTIGIELVSEGALIKTDTGYESELGHKVKPENVVTLEEEWRGFKYFDRYDKEQIDSLIMLLFYLCDTHNIKRQIVGDLRTYNPDLRSFEGIFTHAQVRTDKKDVHPAFPLERVAKWAKLNVI